MATNRTLLHRRYRVVSPIGAGGSGSVWLADDQRLPGRQCAVKEIVVPADLPAAETAVLRRSLHAEATTLARLDHPALPLVLTAVDPGKGPPPRRITLHVGPIIDANGHPVPDGTLVDLSSEPAGALDPAGSRLLTKDGVAQATVTLLAGGMITLHARSGAAAEAEPLRIEVPQPPTATPAATSAASGRPGQREPRAADGTPPSGPGPIDLLVALATALTAAAGLAVVHRADRGAAVGRALTVASASLAGYCAYAAALRLGAIGRPPGWVAGVDSLVVSGAGAVVAALAASVGSRWRRDRARADDQPGSRMTSPAD